MSANRTIVWFREDLRIHDNEALHLALEHSEEIVPVYVFDTHRFFGKSTYGFPKIGKFRAKFILESVIDLRNNLRKLGSDLIIRIGKPEEEVAEIALQVKADRVYCNMERMHEEVKVQDQLEKNLWRHGIEMSFWRGKMLYYTQDLPFPVSHAPDIFTQFRKELEKIIKVRCPFTAPEAIKPFSPEIEVGETPSLEDLGHETFKNDHRSVLNFVGGESAGLERLRYYLWESNLIKNYKETRNGLIGGDYSSKLSPWLAQGCLSPKKIYFEIKRYEQECVKNDSTYHLFFELLWRDFFRLMGKKHSNAIFSPGGIQNNFEHDTSNDMTLFKIWQQGRCGVPFIDANMRELNNTGFMSNRGRQNVASFLVKDLKVDWLLGAEYFESMLIDYDVCSNYGNWNYIAGVGSDPRDNRYFNILSQAKRYDPSGEFVKLWLPELADLPSGKVHQPDALSDEELAESSILLGADYPKAVVSTQKWA